HQYFYPHARSTALQEADFVLVVGTRLNYVFSYGRPPRFNPRATFVRIDSDPSEIARSDQLDIGIVGDARTVLEQLLEASTAADPARYSAWRETLAGIVAARREKQEAEIATGDKPIHPNRLCREIRDFMDRAGLLVVDGQEILNHGRQVLPTYSPRHRL